MLCVNVFNLTPLTESNNFQVIFTHLEKVSICGFDLETTIFQRIKIIKGLSTKGCSEEKCKS